MEQGGKNPCEGVPEEQLQAAVRILQALLNNGTPREDAYDQITLAVRSSQVAECVKRRHEELAKKVSLIPTSARVLDEPGPQPWYEGPQPDDRHWPRLKELLSEGGWPDTAIDDLDRTTTKIVQYLGDPHGAEAFCRKGLVLGYVQSGKTTNFTATMAKAADAGYRLFIVLSGIHNGLRRQTQERLDRQLVEVDKEHWARVTDAESDFRGDRNVNFMLSPQRGTARVLGVVKKNASRLRRLLDWLRDANENVLENCPVLIIDDEADQASVNTARPENDPSTINGLLLQILEHLPKVSYVGYTATPFANLLIDPNVPVQLYPRDFIIDLPRPDGYFGTESLFGREPLAQDGDNASRSDGLDMIRIVPDQEAARLTPSGGRRGAVEEFKPEVPPSLRDALWYFWMSTAARRIRGKGNRHATMLVHTSNRIFAHFALRDAISREVEDARAMVHRAESGDMQRLRELWEREIDRVPAEEFGHEPIPFPQIAERLPAVLDATEVIVDNGASTDRLAYDDAEPATVIAVGGNTLSRGLTLEGLCVSYFVRSASAYDALLQMGRWFGYRHGYEDLPRVWMTAELRAWFHDLATVEQEIRYDIERYEIEGATPLELGVRIRTHPSLAITAAAKMQAAVPAKVSYSGRRVQTILFNHRDPDWLGRNIAASRELINALSAHGAFEDVGGRYVMRGVPQDPILNFLGRYSFHENARELNAELIQRYIRSQNEHDELTRWSVAIMGRPNVDEALGTIDLGLPTEVALINRSQVPHPPGQSYANIKSLMSKEDRAVDLGLAARDIPSENGKLEKLRDSEERGGMGDDSGLLLIYPISKDSRPRDKENRDPLEAVDHVIGVGLVFPTARTEEAAFEYMTVDLSAQRIEEPTAEDEPEDPDEEAENGAG
jgi:hypothetical protein